MAARKHIYYSGDVQGVGFRFTTRRVAAGRDVAGFVRNLSDGRVELVVEGEPPAVDAMLGELEGSMGGHIRDRTVHDEPPAGLSGFEVRPTR